MKAPPRRIEAPAALTARAVSISCSRLSTTQGPAIRTGWPCLLLTAAFLTLIDVIIDPVALRGDRWFLGQIYGYPDPGLYFGIPLMNFVGWAVVGLVALSVYFVADRRFPSLTPSSTVTRDLLLGCVLYYAVLLFNLTITFWIGEPLLGLVGIMIYSPVTILFALRLLNRVPGAAVSLPASAVRPLTSQQ